MSYAVSAPLQAAIYDRLSMDIGVTDAVGPHIYDALPSGTVPSLYVAIGAETVKDRSDKTGHGARHEFIVSVICDGAGFQAAKVAAGAVTDALVDADMALSRGNLVSLAFLRAKAATVGTGGQRRIDLTFVARIED